MFQFEAKTLTRLRKQHSNLTQTKDRNYDFNMDFGIGDSNAIKPKKNVHQRVGSNLTNSSVLDGTKKSIQNFKNVLTDSMFEKKFQIFVEKSLHTISDIR